MTHLIALIRKDLADPLGSTITVALVAAFAALVVILAISLEQEYLLDSHDSIRAVGAEDECAFGTKDVIRYAGQLYCIGEP